MQNSILKRHYIDYLEIIKINKKIESVNLTELEVQNLYNKKYQLTEFEIYKYITAYDYIVDSLNCKKYKLNEGITENHYKYDNILIDLFYKDIPSDILRIHPISTVFNNTNWSDNVEVWDDNDGYEDYISSINPKDYTSHKSIDSDYAGNSYTYYVFKQLVKLFLREVYLYKFNDSFLTYNELKGEYLASLYDGDSEYRGDFNDDWDNKTKDSYYDEHFPLKIKDIRYKNKGQDPIPQSITFSQWMYENNVKKLKYQCIKVIDPSNLDYQTISDLKIYLIDMDIFSNYQDSYDSLIELRFNSFC